MNAKEILKDLYEKELMAGSPMPQDEWREMMEDDAWLNLTLKAMEAYHRARVEGVTDGKSQTEMYHLKTPIDPKEKGEDSAYRAGRVSGMAYVRDKLLN